MSIVEKCIVVGENLRETREGVIALQANESFVESLNEIERSIFVPLFHRLQWGLHFSTNAMCVELLRYNTNTSGIGAVVANILSNPRLDSMVETMKPLLLFANNFNQVAFQQVVPYVLPEMIQATPALIRSIQDLMVECQKIKFTQQIIKRMQDEEFRKQMNKYDVAIAQFKRNPPCSKKDRALIKELIKQGCNKDDVELIHAFVTLRLLILQTIYESFMGKIFYLDEVGDVLQTKKHELREITFLKMKLIPKKESMTREEKWTLVIRKEDGSKVYGHVHEKQIFYSMEMDLPQETITAIIFHLL